MIYPDYSVEGVKFFIGLPCRQEKLLRSEYYELGVDSGDESLLNSGKAYYKVAVREHYEIGERLTFFGETQAVVARVSRLEHREVINEYILMKESDVKTKAYQNEKLIGAALFAKVCQVENELVKVSIDDDENDSDDKAFLNYATVYSSPEGGSWYCMPEVGDRVIVKFPDDIVGHDRTGQDAKFIYDYGNGEIKEISENVISLLYLFRKKYKDKL